VVAHSLPGPNTNMGKWKDWNSYPCIVDLSDCAAETPEGYDRFNAVQLCKLTRFVQRKESPHWLRGEISSWCQFSFLTSIKLKNFSSRVCIHYYSSFVGQSKIIKSDEYLQSMSFFCRLYFSSEERPVGKATTVHKLFQSLCRVALGTKSSFSEE